MELWEIVALLLTGAEIYLAGYALGAWSARKDLDL